MQHQVNILDEPGALETLARAAGIPSDLARQRLDSLVRELGEDVAFVSVEELAGELRGQLTPLPETDGNILNRIEEKVRISEKLTDSEELWLRNRIDSIQFTVVE